MKKIITLLAAFALVIGMIPAMTGAAYAEGGGVSVIISHPSSYTTFYTGKNYSFNATIQGAGGGEDSNNSVVWTVLGATSSNTKLEDLGGSTNYNDDRVCYGNLAIGSDETASTLTLKVTSTKYPSKSATLAIPITPVPRITAINITYDPNVVQYNTAYSGKEYSKLMNDGISVTGGAEFGYQSKSNSGLTHEMDGWQAQKDDLLDASKEYRYCYNFYVTEENDWPEAVKAKDFSSLKVTVNGLPVTPIFSYNSSWNCIDVEVPMGHPSTSAIVRNVSIDQKNVSILKGDSASFTATVTGTVSDTSVSWSIAKNKSTATKIDSTGTLTIGSDETAESIDVIATSNADSTKTDTLPVTITAAPLSIDSITVSSRDTTFYTGKTYWLSARILGNELEKGITWAVSGNSSSQTKLGDFYEDTIDENTGTGSTQLTIGNDETASKLTITATSKKDASKVGTFEVPVTAIPRIQEINITYDPAEVPFTTAISGKDFSALMNDKVTITGGASFEYQSKSNSGLVDEGGGWQVQKTDLLDETQEYTYCYDLYARDDTDWPEAVKSNDFSSLKVTVNGTPVTPTYSYNSYWNAVNVYIPMGKPSKPVVPTVQSISIDQSNVSVTKGESTTLSATVKGDVTDKGVTWSLSGNTSAGTKINSAGLLTVAATEDANILHVTATAKADNTKSATIAVAIIDPSNPEGHSCTTKPVAAKAATPSKDGHKAYYTCTDCSKWYWDDDATKLIASHSDVTIPKVSGSKLSTTTYTYSGKAKSPTLTVKDSRGTALKKGTDYTVTTPSGRKNVGTYTYKITLKGNYSGTISKTFTINPVKTSITKLTGAKKSLTVKWTKKSTQVTGYRIQYSTSSKFNSPKYTTVSSYKTTSKTIKKLSAKKKYYVRVQTYKKVSGKTFYSSWSTAKNVKTK